MSLLKLLPNFFSETTYNRQLDGARERHDSLPKTCHDKFQVIAAKDFRIASSIAQQRYAEIAQMLRAVVKEHYDSAEQNKINSILISLIDILASKASIFPDMDYPNIWYTDHFDLIELARNMGFGDEALPHWADEPNDYSRYLEIEASDLVRMLMDLAEEALIENYQPGNDVNRWFRYIARETLKSRKRLSRYRQKQMESLWVTPSILGIEDWDKN